MTLHIGILAHSAEGATLSYRTCWMEGVRRMGAHDHPEITLTGTPMAPTLPAWERGDLSALRALFVSEARKLAAAGADFFILPDNTAHIALEQPGEPFPIPGLHIGEVVAEQAARDSRRKVGILGTDWTMTGTVYPGAFGRRGIDWAVPDEADRAEVHRTIFEELPRHLHRRRAGAVWRDHRQAGRAGLRRGGVGLHRDPAAGDGGEFVAAGAGLDPPPSHRRPRGGA